MSGVTLERHDGALVAAKSSASSQRLQAEADTLSRLQHPGVVELVSFDSGPPATLRTVWAGTDTWDRQPPSEREAISEGLSAVATTLADIHESGICHGAVSPSHVIVGPRGRPVLCGFGDAAPADPDAIKDDMTGLGGIVEHLSQLADDDFRGDLRRMAEFLNGPKPDLHSFVRLVGGLTADAPAPHNRSLPPARTLAIATAVALVVATIGLVTTRSGGDPEQTTDQPRPAAITSTLPEPTSIPPTTTPLTQPTTAPTEMIHQDTAPTIEVTDDGQVVVHAGRRYGLGATQDLVVLGDWDCDGEPTPALLQQSTGVIAVFADWPEPGETISPQSIHATLDTTSLTVERLDGCDLLRARGPYGSFIIESEHS